MVTRKSKGLLAFVLVVLVMLASVGTAEAAFPGQNGTIAFESNRHVAPGEIYAINPGGTATRVTFSNGSSDPTYSPMAPKSPSCPATPAAATRSS